MKAKHQRLTLAIVAVVALIGAGLLAASALKDQAAYFYTASDIKANKADDGKAIRLGGMVIEGSLAKADDGVTVNFLVGDGKTQVPVRFRGITPDLFVEGSGVVAEGRMEAGGVFVADNLLAKHDENYVPREMQGIDMSGKPKPSGPASEALQSKESPAT